MISGGNGALSMTSSSNNVSDSGQPGILSSVTHNFARLFQRDTNSSSRSTHSDDTWVQCRQEMESLSPDDQLPESMKKLQIPLIWLGPTERELEMREQHVGVGTILRKFVDARLKCCIYGTPDKEKEDLLKDYLYQEIDGIVFDAHTKWRVPCGPLYNRESADASAISAFSTMFAQVCAVGKVAMEHPGMKTQIDAKLPKSFIDRMIPSAAGLHELFLQEVKNIRCGLLRGIKKLDDKEMMKQAAVILLTHATTALVQGLGAIELTAAAALVAVGGTAAGAAITSTSDSSAEHVFQDSAGQLIWQLTGAFEPFPGSGDLARTAVEVFQLWAFPDQSHLKDDLNCVPYLDPKQVDEKCKGDKRPVAADLLQENRMFLQPLAHSMWSE